MNWKQRGKGRQGIKQPGQPNKTEAAYMSHLNERKAAGEIVEWWFERFTLTLSHSRPNVMGQRYTPDFAVMLPDGEIEFHEVKGFRYEKNMNKLKIAGELFPFVFRLVTRRKKADGGGWNIEEH